MAAPVTRRTQKTGPDATPIQAARYGLLSEIVLLIASSPDLPSLLPRFVSQVKWVLDFDRCTLAVANEDGQTYRLETLLETRRQVAPALQERLPVAQGLAGDVLRQRQVRLLSGPQQVPAAFPDEADPALLDGSLATVLALPLEAYGQVYGVLIFGCRQPECYGREDLKVAGSIATHLALALDRWQHTQQLRQQHECPGRPARDHDRPDQPAGAERSPAGHRHPRRPAARRPPRLPLPAGRGPGRPGAEGGDRRLRPDHRRPHAPGQRRSQGTSWTAGGPW